MLVRWLMTSLRMTARDYCAVSACSSPLTLSVNALTPACWRRGVGLSADVHHPPHHPVAGIWNKANFPFHQPGLFTGFWAVRSRTPPHIPFSYIIMFSTAKFKFQILNYAENYHRRKQGFFSRKIRHCTFLWVRWKSKHSQNWYLISQ